ncbi:hypothetical protein WPS_02520 [Vulcanimicrobium alpinum]|uniref:Uncharacterized protein n=1 Tax=Vulcanimicrobium alpinum TaxID=3016050 RepID=A0AAN2C8G3_UNVUL|nr:hypothetical protein WPS_02520 [Vulcanimicrobium alpinum]
MTALRARREKSRCDEAAQVFARGRSGDARVAPELSRQAFRPVHQAFDHGRARRVAEQPRDRRDVVHAARSVAALRARGAPAAISTPSATTA